jgi:hypothetical protein
VPERLIAKLFVVLLLGAISVAQTPLTANSSERTTSSSSSRVAADKTGWDSLKQLGLYHEAKVVLTNAESYQGKLIAVNEDALVLHSGSSDQTFARDRVQRISIRRPGHRGRNALIGLGIGAGAGLGWGASLDNNGSAFTKNMGKPIGASLFGLAGAGVGALIPTGGWQEVYRLR